MISIIICTYNSNSTIRRCIKSIFEDKNLEREIIVIDANSNDGTIKTLEKFKDKITLIKNNETISLGVAREIGIKKAKGEYISFIDSDVVVPKDWFEKALNIIKKKDNIAAVGGPGISPYNDIVSKTINHLLYGRSNKDELVYVKSLPTMNILYDRKSIEGLKFNKNLWMGEDVDFSFKILKRGYKLIFSRDLWVYHFHPTTFKKMIRKWYHYGLFYRFPYNIHREMRTKIFYVRIYFFPLLFLFAIFSIFSNFFFLLFILQVFSVFFAYSFIGFNIIRIKEIPSFVTIQSFKQYAQLFGVFISFFRGNKALSR